MGLRIIEPPVGPGLVGILIYGIFDFVHIGHASVDMRVETESVYFFFFGAILP